MTAILFVYDCHHHRLEIFGVIKSDSEMGIEKGENEVFYKQTGRVPKNSPCNRVVQLIAFYNRYSVSLYLIRPSSWLRQRFLFRFAVR